MRTIHLLNGIAVNLTAQLEIAGIFYPAGALIGREAEFGIATVTLPDYPDPRYATWVEHPDGSLTITARPQAELDAQLALDRQSCITQLDGLTKAIRVLVSGTHDELQVSGWNNKLRIALANKAGTASASEVQVLSIEAALRGKGETVAVLTDKIIANATGYAAVIAILDGIKTAALAQVAVAAEADLPTIPSATRALMLAELSKVGVVIPVGELPL